MQTSPDQTDNRLTADKFEALLDALETLYIKNNISGRLQFAKQWPDAAIFLFGDELVRYDREGTSERERRQELEEQADDKRLSLIEILNTLEEKSVVKGALDIPYVQALIKELGRKMALLVYSRRIVDRIMPPPAEEMIKVDPAKDVKNQKPLEALSEDIAAIDQPLNDSAA